MGEDTESRPSRYGGIGAAIVVDMR
jgi:hypothetical protein